MSLKAFHVFFVAIATLFALGVGTWGVRDYRETASMMSLALAIGAFLVGVAMFIYGLWMLRKFKNVSYI